MADIEAMKERFKSEQEISLQLPVTLKNGCQVTDINGTCSQCNRTVPDNALRGNIIESFDVVIFDAHGLCTDCLKLFPIFGRVKPSGSSMIVEYISHGEWVYQPLMKVTAFMRFKDKLKQLLSSCWS